MVGTPKKTSMPASSSSSRAPSAVNLGSSISSAPTRSPVLSTQVWPKVWKSGSPPKSLSPRRKSMVFSSVVWVCSIKARCVPSAPLGLPVVPEVYRIVARSSGRRGW